MTEIEPRAPEKTYKCEDCGREFYRPQNLGRHRAIRHGVPSRNKQKYGPPITTKSADTMEIIREFERSAATMVGLLKALVVESNVYRKERDELAKFKEKIVGFTSVNKGGRSATEEH